MRMPPRTPYDGENINAYSDDDVNNDEVAPEPPTNYLNINDNSDGEKNDYEVTPDTSISGRNNEPTDNNI